ncbi:MULTISPECIES: globin-coupled sensor protein [Haloarcula]|uniref:globin-coupled sensor protein n=1 Tax=Haloarcula TaxID=2237 RepID=UPI0023E8C9BD|nr:globin-coupled sensor protein [Halomicroarcula sp. SHR3]
MSHPSQAPGGQLRITATERATVDGSSLTERIGLDRQEIQWRKDFTGFDGRDTARLTDLEGQITARKAGIVDEFYDHLETFDETVEIFGRSSKSVDQLKQSQARYLADLVGGDYDKQYFENRARIGKIHDMLELGPKIYLGAYSIYFEHFLTAITDNLLDEVDADEAVLDEFAERALSVFKLINLDQQVAMDTYIDSYSQRLEDAIEKQEQLMAQVQQGLQEPVEELSDSASDVDQTSQRMSAQADEQASSMGEVAGEVADMSATIEEIASTAEEVASTSTTAEDLAADGQEAAEEAADVMSEVDHAVDDASESIGGLQEKADDIGDIVDIIDRIADQTNILALNASIEAARAGEAGDGFAVVADEIKSLAGDSQSHANRIEATIAEMQAETTETVSDLQTVTDRVDEGVEEVQTAMTKLEHIVSAINETAQGIKEVSSATDDQAASTEEVASMVDEVTKSLDEMATDIESLAETNERQTAKVESIAATARQLDTDEASTGGSANPTGQPGTDGAASGPDRLEPDDF